MSKTCEHIGVFGRCNQPVVYEVDESITNHEEWMTGRKIPWSDMPEIIIQPFHPLIPKSLCYYHTKFKKAGDKDVD